MGIENLIVTDLTILVFKQNFHNRFLSLFYNLHGVISILSVCNLQIFENNRFYLVPIETTE